MAPLGTVMVFHLKLENMRLLRLFYTMFMDVTCLKGCVCTCMCACGSEREMGGSVKSISEWAPCEVPSVGLTNITLLNPPFLEDNYCTRNPYSCSSNSV